MITLEHVKLAIEIAEADGGYVGPYFRHYGQHAWDCGTSCCVGGFAHLIATGRPLTCSFDNTFQERSHTCAILYALMHIGDRRVLPVMRAVAFGGDIQHAAAVQRNKGFQIFFPKDGDTIRVYADETHIVTEGIVTVEQCGGALFVVNAETIMSQNSVGVRLCFGTQTT